MTDIDLMLKQIYELNELDKADKAVDVILEFVFMNDEFKTENEYYDAVNEFYDKFDVSKITKGCILCCAPSVTFKYIPQIKNHLPFCKKVMQRYRELGYAEERINKIMGNLLSVGNYWKNMDMLGAGELFGKKPQ